MRGLRGRQARLREVGDEWRAKRVPNKTSTINRDLRTLRAALKQARPEYRFPGGAFFKEDENRVRWLRPEEELLVLETMASPFREIAKVAALTLMRMTEIRLLRREDVHLEQGVILLPKAKAGARPVVLGVDAQKILRKQLETTRMNGVPQPTGRPYSRERIGRVFRQAARAGGLKDFHFHDLRHHGATDGAQRRLQCPDRDGPRRMEDGADDAALRCGHRQDTSSGGRGGQRQRTMATAR